MMTTARFGWWVIPGCIALALVLVSAGCSGCSGQGAQQIEADSDPEAVRVLGPEEPPLDEVDEARRDFLRNHDAMLRILGAPPRLTFESEQVTPRFTITIYTAETIDRTIRVRMNWRLTNAQPEVLRFDVQHREDTDFEREWVAGG